MEKENVFKVIITSVIGALIFGGMALLAVFEGKHSQEKLDHVYGSRWWKNSMGSVIVKILRVYPKSEKVVYSKYSTTGKNLGTCQMDFDRFLDTYECSEEDYDF